MEEKKRKKFSGTVVIAIIIGLLIGISGSYIVYYCYSKTNDAKCIEQETKEQKKETESYDNSKEFINYHLDDAYKMKQLLFEFSSIRALTTEEWAKELYGQDKTIIKDVDKKLLYTVAYEYILRNAYYCPFDSVIEGVGVGHHVCDADEIRSYVMAQFGYYFDNKEFPHSDVAFFNESHQTMCPWVEYDADNNKYRVSFSCGHAVVPPSIYKFDFEDNNYIAYGTITLPDYLTKDNISIDIEGNYKYTFKKDKQQNLYLYSIEKINDDTK